MSKINWKTYSTDINPYMRALKWTCGDACPLFSNLGGHARLLCVALNGGVHISSDLWEGLLSWSG